MLGAEVVPASCIIPSGFLDSTVTMRYLFGVATVLCAITLGSAAPVAGQHAERYLTRAMIIFLYALNKPGMWANAHFTSGE